MTVTIPANVLIGIRAVQAIFALIVLGTAAYVAHWWYGAWHAYSPPEYSFLIFTALWTLLVLVYLILVPLRFSNSVLHHKFVILALEGLTTLFWFASFIAAAVFLTGRVCWGGICSTAVASTVFAAFNWLLFAITLALSIFHLFSSRNTVGRSEKPVVVQEGV